MRRFRFTLGDLLAGTVALAMLLVVARSMGQTEREPYDFCSDVAWSPDGRLIAGVFHHDGRCCVAIYAADSGDVVQRLEQPEGGTYLLRFSQDSRTLIVAGDDLSTWDITSGQRLVVLDQQRYDSLAVSPDGAKLAAGGPECFVACWNLSTGEQLGSWNLGGDPHIWSPVVFTPDSRYLLACSWAKRNIVKMDLATQKVSNDHAPLVGDGIPLLAIRLSEPSLLVVSDVMTGCGTCPNMLDVYRLDAASLARPDKGNSQRIEIDGEGTYEGCLSPDGSVFASRCRRPPGVEWRRLNGDQAGVCLFTGEADHGLPLPLAFSPDNQRLAMGLPTRLQVAILSNGRQVLDLSVPWPPDYSGVWTGLALAAGAIFCVWYIGYRAMSMAQKKTLPAAG